MPQVLLVNPSERKGKPKMAKKARTAAQKRATAKLVASNKARRAASAPKRRKARSVTRRSNPITTTFSTRKRRKARSAPKAARRVTRRRRSNPIGGMGDFLTGTLMPSAIGGGGALLLDVALAVLPIPASLKVGALAPVVKIAGAVGLGMAAGMVVSRKTANQIAAGALTVTMYNIAKGLLVKATGGKIPGLAGHDEYYSLMPSGVGEYVGEYVGDGDAMGAIPFDDGVGYINSGMQVGEYVEMTDAVDGFETGVYR